VSGELPGDDGAGLQQTRQPLPQPGARRRRHSDYPRYHHRQRTERESWAPAGFFSAVGNEGV